MDAKTTWATTVLAAVVGFAGALGGSVVGANAALSAADQQAQSQREDRLTAERTEMNLLVLDAGLGLWGAWTMYTANYPEVPRDQAYMDANVTPRLNELQKNVTTFRQATARSRAYGSTSAKEATEAMTACSEALLAATEGPNDNRLPPTDEQWLESSICFTDAAAALELVIQNETLPAQIKSEAAGCGFFWCPFG